MQKRLLQQNPLTIVMQTSKELRDDDLLAVCIYLDERNKR